MVTLIPIDDITGPAGPGASGSDFYPEDFGDGAPGYPNDDVPAINAAITAAADDGGGVVRMASRKLYGGDGEILQKNGVTVIGSGASAFGSTAVGIKALTSDFRYNYGDSSGNPYPGPLKKLQLDGAGLATELLRAEATDGVMEDLMVVRGAGNGLVFAGAQNTTFRGGGIHDFANGAGAVFRNRDGTTTNGLNTQGAGHCRIEGNTHITTCDKLILQDYVHTYPAELMEYWPHDNVIDGCIIEQYQDDYSCLIHVMDGEMQILGGTVVTGSRGLGPATKDCVILVENQLRPTNPTKLTMAFFYAGGGAASPTDLIRSNSYGLANVVRLKNFGQTANTDYILCDDRAGGGAGLIGGIDGDLDMSGGQVLARGINGGTLGGLEMLRHQPLQLKMIDGMGAPLQIGKDGESKNRLQITDTGSIQALNGVDSTIQASIVRSGAGWAINGNNVVQLIAYTTATRPAASGLPNRIILDVTLNQLIWSDGTDWRNVGTGSVV